MKSTQSSRAVRVCNNYKRLSGRFVLAHTHVHAHPLAKKKSGPTNNRPYKSDFCKHTQALCRSWGCTAPRPCRVSAELRGAWCLALRSHHAHVQSGELFWGRLLSAHRLHMILLHFVEKKKKNHKKKKSSQIAKWRGSCEMAVWKNSAEGTLSRLRLMSGIIHQPGRDPLTTVVLLPSLGVRSLLWGRNMMN